MITLHPAVTLVLLNLWLTGTTLLALATHRAIVRRGNSQMQAWVGAFAIALIAPSTLVTWFLLLSLGIALSIALAAAGSALVGLVALTRLEPHQGSVHRLSIRDRVLDLGPPALVVAVVVAVSLWAVLAKPVAEVDGLLYHGPAAANILQHDSLLHWDGTSPWIFYPNLGAVHNAVMATLLRSTTLMDAVQIPYLILLVLIGWTWAGRGHPRLLAGMTSCALVVTPAVYVEARTLYVDIMFAALLLAALWMLTLWWRLHDRWWLAFGGLALGAAASTKPVGAVLAALTGVIVLLAAAGRRVPFKDLLPLAATTLLGGAPFYVRNIVEFGNPIYPVSVDLGPLHFSGLFELTSFYATDIAPAEVAGLPNPIGFAKNVLLSIVSEPDVIYYDARLGAFGSIVVPALGVLTVVAMAALARSGLPNRKSRITESIWPILLAVLYLLVQPQSWNPRYAIVAFSLLVVSVGLALDNLALSRVVGLWTAILLSITWIFSIYQTEGKMLQGLSVIQAASRADRAWNQGITGANFAYQSNYSWLTGAPCGTRVLVAATTFQEGFLNAYNLGFWGDNLCNDVRMIRDDRTPGSSGELPPRPNLRQAVLEADYLVVFEADRALVEETGQRNGLTVNVVSDPPDLFGADQVVFKVESDS